ncbi:MAG: NADH:ubiquinone oxidoreductase [Nitrospirae bacterium]|nr:MAG: NADH:ubiquinone oxidoreductase [Nitrospirota bacterium]
MAGAAAEGKNFLGVPVYRPRVAFFELSSCEGCQLQLLNNEATLLDFLSLVEVVNFREGMSGGTDDYEIAFVEGSVTRSDEVERLKKIRANAKVLVAFGSCACFGGVNQLKNRFSPDWVKKEVYGDHPVETSPARPLEDFVTIDLRIFGCPVKKEEVEKIVAGIAIGTAIAYPKYPVCMECKANGNICLFDVGEPCLGPVTRAGCDSWCPNNRAGCWGCRGPADDINIEQMISIMDKHGFTKDTIMDRLECFGGFAAYAGQLRESLNAEDRG